MRYMVKCIEQLLMTEPKEWKVTKLPRNGPKPGQHMSHWMRGKERGDLTWEKRRRKAIDGGKL